MGMFVPFLIGSQMLIAVADTVPSLNFAQTCRAGASVTGTAKPSQSDIDACKQNEQEARDAIAKDWEQFSAESKTRCLRTTRHYQPSYVELQECLETARDAASSPEVNQSTTQRSPPERLTLRKHRHYRRSPLHHARSRHRSVR